MKILRIPPYSVQIRENTDQKNSKCGQFLRSGFVRGKARSHKSRPVTDIVICLVIKLGTLLPIKTSSWSLPLNHKEALTEC